MCKYIYKYIYKYKQIQVYIYTALPLVSASDAVWILWNCASLIGSSPTCKHTQITHLPTHTYKFGSTAAKRRKNNLKHLKDFRLKAKAELSIRGILTVDTSILPANMRELSVASQTKQRGRLDLVELCQLDRVVTHLPTHTHSCTSLIRNRRPPRNSIEP